MPVQLDEASDTKYSVNAKETVAGFADQVKKYKAGNLGENPLAFMDFGVADPRFWTVVVRLAADQSTIWNVELRHASDAHHRGDVQRN